MVRTMLKTDPNSDAVCPTINLIIYHTKQKSLGLKKAHVQCCIALFEILRSCTKSHRENDWFYITVVVDQLLYPSLSWKPGQTKMHSNTNSSVRLGDHSVQSIPLSLTFWLFLFPTNRQKTNIWQHCTFQNLSVWVLYKKKKSVHLFSSWLSGLS